MSKTGRTFVIAGAGIAGLTLALALAKFGARVVVLERHHRIQEFGAGLQVAPNARRILERLGTGKFLVPKAFLPEAIDVYPLGDETPAISIPLGQSVTHTYGVPYGVMHRADLADALFQACRRFASIDIQFGVTGTQVVSHSRGLTVTYDEATGRTQALHPFAFIGADGVHSATRIDLLQGPRAHYSGYVAWRALLPLDAVAELVALDRTSLLLGPGFHAVLYPLAARGKLNVAAFTRAAPPSPDEAEIPAAIGLPVSARKSRHFSALARVAGDTWTRWPLYSVETPKWHQGAIGLIGDAAHAMLPFQAQGAAMAIEDAAVLAPLLITEPSADDAFARYEGLRQARVSRVAQVSARNGQVFHLPMPFALARNAAFALGIGRNQIRQLDWLYSYDPTPEVPTRPRQHRGVSS